MKGFTLIELMISVTLLMIFTVSGAIYLNNFNTKQKLDRVKSEVESLVRLAQNFAKVRQYPAGGSGEVNYVGLSKSATGNIEIVVNGVGESYVSTKINESGLVVTLNPTTMYFWGGTGHLSSNINGNFFGPNQKANITISLNQGIAETRVVIINFLGGVE
ncbi:MAG: type II secretion system protein [Candidatus Shapirobacteria bacterium]